MLAVQSHTRIYKSFLCDNVSYPDMGFCFISVAVDERHIHCGVNVKLKADGRYLGYRSR